MKSLKILMQGGNQKS